METSQHGEPHTKYLHMSQVKKDHFKQLLCVMFLSPQIKTISMSFNRKKIRF